MKKKIIPCCSQRLLSQVQPVGAIAFLYLTEKGNDARRGLKKKIKGIAKDAAINTISQKTRIQKKVVKAAVDEVALCFRKVSPMLLS